MSKTWVDNGKIFTSEVYETRDVNLALDKHLHILTVVQIRPCQNSTDFYWVAKCNYNNDVILIDAICESNDPKDIVLIKKWYVI